MKWKRTRFHFAAASFVSHLFSFLLEKKAYNERQYLKERMEETENGERIV